MPQNRRGIRIFAEGFGIAIGENFHHPIVKIIHRMILNRAKAAVVFLACFINIRAQPDADVLVLAAQPNFFWLQQLDVLHRNFGDAIRAAMQFLFFPGKIGEFESFFGNFYFRRWRGGRNRRYFGNYVQYLLGLFHPLQFSFR